MLGLPAHTEINKCIYKETFYRNVGVSSKLKKLFKDDVYKMTLANKLSPTTLKCNRGRLVEEILVIYMQPKNDTIDDDIFVFIDKNIQYHILFIVQQASNLKLLTAYKERSKIDNSAFVINKYYSKTVSADFEFYVRGLNMDKIYENLVRFLADDKLLQSENSKTLKQSYDKQTEIDKISAQIDRLTTRMNKEKQFNKQIDIKDKIAKLQSQLN